MLTRLTSTYVVLHVSTACLCACCAYSVKTYIIYMFEHNSALALIQKTVLLQKI